MLRSNTTLVTAQEGPKMNATTARPGKASKSNKNSMLVSAFFVMLCLCLLHNVTDAAVYKKRAIASATESTTVPAVKECHKNTPCGWAIYIPFTRRIDYFMKNTCICNPNLACLQTDDDLTVNAYVFRCTTPVPLTTTEITPTTIRDLSEEYLHSSEAELYH